MLVNRRANISPVKMLRANNIHLRRQQGYSYFVVAIEKVGKIYLGLGIRNFNHKVCVNKTDEKFGSIQFSCW